MSEEANQERHDRLMAQAKPVTDWEWLIDEPLYARNMLPEERGRVLVWDAGCRWSCILGWQEGVIGDTSVYMTVNGEIVDFGDLFPAVLGIMDAIEAGEPDEDVFIPGWTEDGIETEVPSNHAPWKPPKKFAISLRKPYENTRRLVGPFVSKDLAEAYGRAQFWKTSESWYVGPFEKPDSVTLEGAQHILEEEKVKDFQRIDVQMDEELATREDYFGAESERDPKDI